jgi:hypothetical protein
MGYTSETSAKLSTFRRKFLAHLNAGTRPYPPDDLPCPAWTPTTLIAAMRRRLGAKTPSPVAVRRWFRDDVVPRELYIDAILDALFGDDPNLAAERKLFHALWQAARVETQRGGTGDDDEPHDIDPSPSTEDWIVSDATHLSQGLAALLIHPPPPANDPNTFQLRVSLSLALYPDEIDDQPILLGLKQAQIVPRYTACVPAERHPFPDILRPSGLNDTVLGPKSIEGLLDGIALDNATLATMNPTGNTLPKITLELQSRRSDLEVLQDDESRAISPNKHKAVQLFLQSCLIETTQGRVVWSHAELRRRGPDEADT